MNGTADSAKDTCDMDDGMKGELRGRRLHAAGLEELEAEEAIDTKLCGMDTIMEGGACSQAPTNSNAQEAIDTKVYGMEAIMEVTAHFESATMDTAAGGATLMSRTAAELEELEAEQQWLSRSNTTAYQGDDDAWLEEGCGRQRLHDSELQELEAEQRRRRRSNDMLASPCVPSLWPETCVRATARRCGAPRDVAPTTTSDAPSAYGGAG